MERRKFISKGLAAGAIIPATYATLLSSEVKAEESIAKTETEANKMAEDDGIIIERSVSGRPHEGKVLAVIQPHVDDCTLFAGGTIAKLISEGYTG
ncbi:MAG: hypothetical protein ACOYKR_09325, partial [Sphingobacterium thalpophilum]